MKKLNRMEISALTDKIITDLQLESKNKKEDKSILLQKEVKDYFKIKKELIKLETQEDNLRRKRDEAFDKITWKGQKLQMWGRNQSEKDFLNYTKKTNNINRDNIINKLILAQIDAKDINELISKVKNEL